MDTAVITPAIGTQQRQVLEHLIKIGTISGLEAQALYRVSSITKVISVLNRTWPISKEWKKDNTGKRYARYHMADCFRSHGRTLLNLEAA